MKTMIMPNEVLLPAVGEIVADGGSVTLKTKGMSMMPFIRGDRDCVILVKPSALKVGDIVLAKVNGGAYVLHRIFSAEGDRLVLMGDGNLKGKEKCMVSDVLALAVTIVKENGKEIDCTSSMHRFLARLWRILLPFRRYLLAIYRRIFK